MALILDQLAKIYDVSKEQSSRLSAAAAAGAVTLTLEDTTGLSANDYIILGDLGREGSEIVKITTVDSKTQLTVPAISFAHKILSPTFRTPYNQIKVYSSATESGTFAEIASSPADMSVDQQYTYFVDASGSATKWYKYSYYNETTTGESSQSSAYLAGKTNQIITLKQLKKSLGKDLDDHKNDDFYQDAIDWATNYIIEKTRVQYVSKSVTSEKHNIKANQRSVFPKYFPIYGQPTTVDDDGDTLTYDSDPDLTEYFYFPGYIRKAIGDFTPGHNRVTLTYTAYRPPSAEIKYACLEIAGIFAGEKVRTYEDGEGVTQSVLLRNIPADIKEILARNMRKEI